MIGASVVLAVMAIDRAPQSPRVALLLAMLIAYVVFLSVSRARRRPRPAASSRAR